MIIIDYFFFKFSLPEDLGSGCSKLTASLVNVRLKFQTLISEMRHFLFLLKNCQKLFSFFQ